MGRARAVWQPLPFRHANIEKVGNCAELSIDFGLHSALYYTIAENLFQQLSKKGMGQWGLRVGLVSENGFENGTK